MLKLWHLINKGVVHLVDSYAFAHGRLLLLPSTLKDYRGKAVNIAKLEAHKSRSPLNADWCFIPLCQWVFARRLSSFDSQGQKFGLRMYKCWLINKNTSLSISYIVDCNYDQSKIHGRNFPVLTLWNSPLTLHSNIVRWSCSSSATVHLNQTHF